MQKRNLSFDKKQYFNLAQQAGICYEIAARKGHMSVTGRLPMPAKQKAARNKRRKMATQSRRKNRGA